MKIFAITLIMSTSLLAGTAHAGAYRVLGVCESVETDLVTQSVTVYMDIKTKSFYADVWNNVKNVYVAFRVPVSTGLELTLKGETVLTLKSESLGLLISKNLSTNSVVAKVSSSLVGDSGKASVLQCDEDMF